MKAPILPILLAFLLAGCASQEKPPEAADPDASGPPEAPAPADGAPGAPSAPDAPRPGLPVPSARLSGCKVTEYIPLMPTAHDPAWLPPGYGHPAWDPMLRSMFILMPECDTAVLDGTQALEDVRLAVVLVRVEAPQPSPEGDHLVVELYASPPAFADHLRRHGIPALDATIEATVAQTAGKAVVATADGPRFTITQSVHDERGMRSASSERWHAWDGTAGSPAWLDARWSFQGGDAAPHPASLQAEGGRLATLEGAAPGVQGGASRMGAEGTIELHYGPPAAPVTSGG